VTNWESAELTKYAANAFLATKISFINEIANLCEAVGADVHAVAKGMGLDGRIGKKFLHPGPGYGGSCFPKDTKAITATANKFKTNLTVIKSVIKSNENRSSLMLKRVFDILKNKVNNKNICFLGVTFKANTDDMRDSSSLTMIPALIKKVAKINYFYPTGEKLEFNKFKNFIFSSNIKDAIKRSDLIIIHTEWNDFKNINFKKDVKNKKFSIFDMRNIYSVDKMKDNKIKYFSIGN
jgi:UDPglucose 6-dehydrogenase